MVDKTKRKNYMESRITEGKKEIGAKSLDSDNQPTAFQKKYAKGLKEQKDFMEGSKARKYLGDLYAAGFSEKDELPTLKDDDPRLKNNTGAQGRNKGRKDMAEAKKKNMKKGGMVKKKKYCKDGCAIRGKTRGKLL